jgi:hypothetical protein
MRFRLHDSNAAQAGRPNHPAAANLASRVKDAKITPKLNLSFKVFFYEKRKCGIGNGRLVLSPGGLWWWRHFR